MLAHPCLTALRRATLLTGALRYRSHSAVLKEFAPMYTKIATSVDTDISDSTIEPLNINRLTFIGGGNMAEAIISGLMVQELLPPSKMMVSAPTEGAVHAAEAVNSLTTNVETRKKFQQMNIPTAAENEKALDSADVVVIAVKPQMLPQVLHGRLHMHFTQILSKIFPEMVEHMKPDALVISIAAGKLVQQTMLGSALYMQASGKHPVVLRNQITSPGTMDRLLKDCPHTQIGGTTAAAMYRAEKSGFRAVIADSIWAAYEQSKALGAQKRT
ncbi:hypothetical protein DYB32_002833 [Aphanomyces invadans]|uniref:Pyrroline-5-carboxylate reductase catalytic N-terminal domain-containing protein n=1 Tax=Aphanomyces invadans TaxID=157072 RepID=A0A3R6Z789_9STRA|nr:hypothetical protein DYB32_002833 [Aphanomyces invadans]